QLDESIKNILLKINFTSRYKILSDRYQFSYEEAWKNYSNEEVIQILSDLGYQAKFIKSENYFKIVNLVSPYKIQFNISLKSGGVELIWGLEKNGKRVQLGGPWGVIKKLIDDESNENIKLPIFRNY